MKRRMNKKELGIILKEGEGYNVEFKEGFNNLDKEIVEDVMKFVRLYSKVAYRFTGMPQRKHIYKYPFEAIREAVINSVMHKYYFEHGHNNILRFFPERIRIENYWQEPPNFILGETVFRRNHIIAELFGRIHYGEKMGTGLERINEICRKDNVPVPDIEFNENYFYVTFRPSEEYLKLAKDNTTQKTTQKILSAIKENPGITREELARVLGVTPDGIKYHLDNLKKKSLLRRVGGRKEGYWEVLGEVEQE